MRRVLLRVYGKLHPVNHDAWPATGYGLPVTWWQRARAGIGRRDVVLVVGLAATLVVDSLLSSKGNLTLAAVPAVALVTVPLLWRSVAPKAVLYLVVVGVVLCLMTLKPVDVVVVPVMVAAFTVALHSDRLRSLVLALVSVSIAILCVLLFSEGGADPADLVMNSAFLLLAVATGDAVRVRRAYREAAAGREAEREREQRAEAQRMLAEERLRIAREVHDVVAHAMVAINVQAGVAAHVLDRRPEQVRSALHEIKATSGAALSDLRATLGLLREEGAAAPVRPAEGLADVPELASPLRAAGIEVDVTVQGLRDHVPSPVGAAAYRIVQEASTNILRHAGARRAIIFVDVGREALEVRVDDDGAALLAIGGPVAAGSGSGLRGMAERAATLGGRLEAGRQDDGGWRVHAVLPFA